MCELLGISSKNTIEPRILFKNFKQRGADHPHGWGIGWYPDRSSQVIKESLKSCRSQMANFLTEKGTLSSNLFVAHVRKSTGTQVAHRNTHPFEHTLRGRSYLFAHNGSIQRVNTLRTGRFYPIGETDSETLFCHLMTWIEKNDLDASNPTSMYAFQEHLQRINQLQSSNGQYTKLNCLITDGHILICYADLYRSGLHWLDRSRTYKYQGEMLSDRDYDISISVEKDFDQHVQIVATRAMTRELKWYAFDPGEMRIYQHGKLLFSHSIHRDIMVDDVEVYQSPQWFNKNQIGLPQRLRKQLNVEIGERVLVENAENAIFLSVSKTNRKLLTGGCCQAMHPYKHALIPWAALRKLHLRQLNDREGVPHFKKFYEGVRIIKV